MPGFVFLQSRNTWPPTLYSPVADVRRYVLFVLPWYTGKLMLVPTTSTQPTMSSFTASSAAKSIFGAPSSSLTWTLATFWSFSLLCRVWLYSLCAWKYRYPAVARRAMPTTRKMVLRTFRSRRLRLGRPGSPAVAAPRVGVSGSKPTAPCSIAGAAAGACAVPSGP